MPIAYLETVDSPAGPLAFAVNEAGALVRTRFVEGRYRTTIEQELERMGYSLAHDARRTEQARTQLLEYHHGVRRNFEMPLAFVGTDWQKRIWQELTRIPFGETRSYGALAAQLGRPRAARAVGSANGSNHLPLVVPCHRLIGADGSLTGFEGGIELKALLLAHEARISGSSSTWKS